MALTQPAEEPTASASRPPPGLLVAEIFGPTLQGEGPSAGQSAAFLRLGHCNLTCRWCDTAYTWDATRFDLDLELRRLPEKEVWGQLHKIGAPLVVVTGGEPLMQQRRLVWLADKCRAHKIRLEVETNGTIVPRPAMQQNNITFNTSVKLANSGVAADRRINPVAIRTLARYCRTVWKFVVTEPGDLGEIEELAAEFQFAPSAIWVMPEATTAQDCLDGMRTLAGEVTRRGWNLTSRLHILIWGDVRGH